MNAPLLSVERLTLEFRTRAGVVNALDRVSLEAHRGEIVGVVGESGSGKSVSALSIMGLLPSPPGKISSGPFTSRFACMRIWIPS